MINPILLGNRIEELKKKIDAVSYIVKDYVENYVTALEVEITYNIYNDWFDISIPSTKSYCTVLDFDSFTDFQIQQDYFYTDLTIDEYTQLLKNKENINKAIVQAIMAFKYITNSRY